jgi:hypothetical protein
MRYFAFSLSKKSRITFLLVLLFFLMLLTYSYAQENVLNSTNFKTVVVVNEAGGNLSSANFKSDFSVYYLQGISNSSSQKICLGFICIDFGPRAEAVLVSFVLEVNLSGTVGDTVVIDNNTSPGLFKASDITRYFACIQDATLSNTPIIGVIYAGSGNFRYIRVDPGASFSMRLTQEQQGNKFVIPVTINGCDVVKNRLPLSVPSIFTLPFVSISDILNAIEIITTSSLDIVGDFEKTGSFTLVLEKNETQIIGETP